MDVVELDKLLTLCVAIYTSTHTASHTQQLVVELDKRRRGGVRLTSYTVCGNLVHTLDVLLVWSLITV